MNWKDTFDINSAFKRGYDSGYEDARDEYWCGEVFVKFTAGDMFRKAECPNCGKLVFDHDNYCRGCGRKVLECKEVNL